jgi:hypothetical protein
MVLLHNATELSGKWYGLMYLDAREYFVAPHILSPCLSNWSNFTIGDGSLFATGTAGVVSIVPKAKIYESIYFILGVLNSALFGFYITRHSPVFSGGYYKFSSPYLRKVPFKRISAQNKADEILHKKIDALVRVRVTCSSAKKAEEIDREIDELVFDLYGISGAERKMILKSRPEVKVLENVDDLDEAA